MKRPSFQFYPADWRSNAKLRRCSEAARGAWMDILGLLHDAEEYGLLRWPLADIANAAGVKLKLAKELAEKEVLKGADRGPVKYIYTPRHAGKDGDPVTLVDAQGPCWFSSRFVRDEWVRGRRGQTTQFTSDNQPPKQTPVEKPNNKPMATIGEPEGDGTSVSSSTPISEAKASSIKSRVRARVEETPDFIEFYEVFPLHKARGAAAKAYASALTRASAEKLLEGAKRYARERANEDHQFTKHPATWLNNDCWLDESVSPHGGRNGTGNPNRNRSGAGTAHQRHLEGLALLVNEADGEAECLSGPANDPGRIVEAG